MSEPRGGNSIPCDISFIKARKIYRCHWCDEDIEKDETHAHCRGHWNGDWQDWRMHSLCYDQNDEEISEGFEPFINERPKSIC